MKNPTDAYLHCDTCGTKKFGWVIILEERATEKVVRFTCRVCTNRTQHTIQSKSETIKPLST